MSSSEGASRQDPPFLKAWDDYTAQCQALFERLGNPAVSGVAPTVPPAFLGYWKDFAKSLGMTSDLSPGAQFKPDDVLKSFVPQLGYTREYQEIAARMTLLSTEFQQRYAEFVQQGADIGQRAWQAVQAQASSAAKPSAPTELYDAWIESAERLYAQAAHGESFSKSLAQLCNTLSAFKVERGKLMEAIARQLDLPTRAEVDSLHRQVRDLTTAARQASAPTPRRAKPKPKPRKTRKRSDK